MRIQAAAIAFAAATTPLTASAQETDDRRAFRIVVSYGDLHLTEADDAHVMAERLHTAARRACGGSPAFDEYYDMAPGWAEETFEACYGAAIDTALAQLSAPLVSEAHAGLARKSRTHRSARNAANARE